ncbi:aminotransferase-like domain-containing protein [Micromonospora sp. CPCC 206061]|uniref:aminotransferase-like domain-containing protein n=1 Tax=Micromonospora sp. CPCC 206061 TaxID=3122410 RepID=UPI002FF1ADE0
MRLPVIQYTGTEGVLDLGWGHPDPTLLPVEAWAASTSEAVPAAGWTALTYGYAAGPGQLLEWLTVHIGAIDGRAPEPAELFVTAGASQGLELVSSVLTRPGDVVLVDSPTYHLALRILADRGVELRAAPTDEQGIDPAATARLVGDLRAEGRRVPMLYAVATFNNPSGASMPMPRRRELIRALEGVTIVEDDTYRELAYEGPVPASLWSLASAGVVRLGSFSKTVAPGLRLGYLTADAAFVRRLASRGYVDSGGCVNHTSAMVLAHFATTGRYEAHVSVLRDAYRRRRDTLVTALRSAAPGVEFAVPGGGWFLWLRVPDAASLARRALERGVGLSTGERFHVGGGGGHHLRASFSMYSPADLEEAAHRFAQALPPPP